VSILASEWEGITYAIERQSETGERLLAVIFLSNTAPTDRVPFDAIRSVCANLGLGPDIFESKQ
jgi:hypothetical protein